MDATTLLVWMVAGAFGAGYFVYGKKQQKGIPLVAGILLCVIPYFIENIWLLISICVVLIISPFIIKI
ncbi:MAG TPA: hypothetical protein DCZ94_07160 [Lentisphaeria bacterium]|nr:MAG: hypothetical protein A2X48_10225 [Lentisphaerae bacterium GWF2_49_21]HBC86714.1 hypothetical protein [Lentisphaeria bacterium]